jgi:serine/threonine kinase 38
MDLSKAVLERHKAVKLKAERMKQYLDQKYRKNTEEENEQHQRLQKLEKKMAMMALDETAKDVYRQAFLKAEAQAQQEMCKRMSIYDFEPLSVIGRGAFGEVRLVRMKDGSFSEIYG